METTPPHYTFCNFCCARAAAGAGGGAARTMSQFIEAVLFAEFDIDKGSVLRQQYPEKVSDDEGLLAELMLPEGTHNHFQDWTVFMLNRPSSELVEAPRAPAKRWPAHAYQYNTEMDPPEWALAADAEAAATHWVSIDVPAAQPGSVEQPPVIQIDLGGEKRLRMEQHEELQYVVLQPDFASMYSLEGEALGLHFRSAEHQEEFKAALDAAITAASRPAAASMLWCLNHVSNRRDKTVRRGAQVKAMAVCSRFQFVHVWKVRVYYVHGACTGAHVCKVRVYYVHVQGHTCVCACMCTRVHVCVHVRICACVYDG